MNKPGMKFKVMSPEHSEKIQSKLFEEGYAWSGYDKTVRHDKARHLFAEDGFITFEMNDDAYFDDHQYKEYVLTPFGSLMSVADYYKQPVTAAIKSSAEHASLPGYCHGCNPLTCPSGGQCAPAEKTFEPLPLTPKSEHDRARMLDIVQAIQRYVEAEKKVPDSWLAEFSYLNNLVESK